MTRNEVRAKLATIAADVLSDGKPLPDGDLADALDSMDRLALVVAVEDGFGVVFEPEDDATLLTAEDVVDAVVRRLPRA